MLEINNTEDVPEGNLTILLKLIKPHQHKCPIIMAKYKQDVYHTDLFCGGSNIYLNLITFEGNIFIP